MQDPETGLFHPVPDDDPKKANPGWPIVRIGEEVKFRNWWWRITGFGEDGSVTVKAVRKAKKGFGAPKSKRPKHPALRVNRKRR